MFVRVGVGAPTVAAAVAVPMGNSAPAAAVAAVPQLKLASPAPPQLAAASLLAQAQLQQEVQSVRAQAAQMQQQVQQVLALSQALQGQQQAQAQQHPAAAAAAAVQAAALQGQAQAQAATEASALPNHLGKPAQLDLLAAVAAQQQQQQQQANSAYNQVQQTLATQLLAQQQQHQQQHLANPSALAKPGLTGLSQRQSPSLTNLAAVSGGQVIPGASTSLSHDVTSPKANLPQNSSPTTVAMQPPLDSNDPSKCASMPRDDLNTTAKEKSPATTTATSSKRRPRTAIRTAKEESQPPIQDILSEWEDKKQAKRAAHRLSAHRNRKRKKMFIQDLKDENIELRRKEQILRCIPDIIIAFDASGRLSFVSHSVARFTDHSAKELDRTSFWDLLAEDSARRIKGALADALAVERPPGEDSTPLANGKLIAVALVRKDVGSGGREEDGFAASLTGAVDFTGESPECVCSLRPAHRPSRDPEEDLTPLANEEPMTVALVHKDVESGGKEKDGFAASLKGVVGPPVGSASTDTASLRISELEETLRAEGRRKTASRRRSRAWSGHP